MSSILDLCAELEAEEDARIMRTDYMSVEDARSAVEWMTARMRKETGRPEIRFPSDWIPETGLSVLNGRGKTLAVATLYLEKSSPVAVCGWCIANPENQSFISEKAVRLLLSVMPVYARSKGARHLIAMFGNRGVNRICDDLGFVSGDREVQQKYMVL